MNNIGTLQSYIYVLLYSALLYSLCPIKICAISIFVRPKKYMYFIFGKLSQLITHIYHLFTTYTIISNTNVSIYFMYLHIILKNIVSCLCELVTLM